MQLSSYTPSNYAKEYTKLSGSSQYPMFVATALGVKPCFDKVIDVRKYEEFVSIFKEIIFILS